MSAILKDPTFRPNSLTNLTPNRALYIAEILEMILDQLRNDKCTISHLAFTCKAIAEPALDRLWALNDSLEPFISLLPKELILDVRLEALDSVRQDLMLCLFAG